MSRQKIDENKMESSSRIFLVCAMKGVGGHLMVMRLMLSMVIVKQEIGPKTKHLEVLVELPCSGD